MSEPHVAYAMNNEAATNALVYFNAPSSLLTPTHFWIEFILLAGIVLSMVHAFKHDKAAGGNTARLTLLNCFLYGLMMDIISYYTVENFWHGEFTVMFLYNRLPLYIALFYPSFMYHAIMTIRRYDFTPLKEAIITGFFAGLMYLIFDNTGPILGWWIWAADDPSTFPYVSSVPLTSYHWFFTFTIAFSFVNRWVHGLNGQKAKQLLAIVLQPTLTILLGSLIFIPYNLFGQGMPPYDALPWAQSLTAAVMVHVLTFSAAAWLFLVSWRKPATARDSLLMVFPFMYLVGHVFFNVYAYEAIFNANAEGVVQLAGNALDAGNLVAVIIATVLSAAIILLSHPLTEAKTSP